MVKTIIVPVDGSEHSRKALEFACDLAPRYHARLHIVHVPDIGAHGKTLVLSGVAITIDPSKEELQAAGRLVIESARKLATDKGCDNVSTEVMAGDAVTSILCSVEENDAEMIVMGSRGLSDLKGLLVGSVSHKLNHLARCTCVTVR